MRIVLVNYRYFVSGGPERYMFGIKGLLEKHGHEVIPFSVRYTQNTETEWQRYFVPPIAGEDEIYFKEHSWNFQTIRRALSRTFYSKEVYEKLQQLIHDVQPDAGLVLHYLRKLSPAVLVALHDAGIPIVVRLSDFAMLCPQAHFLRANQICELCKDGRVWPSIKYRCVQDSLGASLVNAIATVYHRKKGFFNLIDAFITPSAFTRGKMIEGGWPAEKLHHIPTFVDLDAFNPTQTKENLISFIGRLQHIKGVHVLLKAFSLAQKRRQGTEVKLVIAGDNTGDEARELKSTARMLKIRNVQFTGQLGKQEVADLLSRSLFSIAPSLWYENMPNSVLESLACGTPVVASNLGSLSEIIDHERNGLLFQTNSADDLALQIDRLLSHAQWCKELGENARKTAEEKYAPEMHYQALMKVYEEILASKS